MCSNHFEDSQFTNKDEKKRLIQTAVPALFDVPNPPKNHTILAALSMPKKNVVAYMAGYLIKNIH